MPHDTSAARPVKKSKGSRFWLSFSAVIVCNFLSALDITAVSTALPTITSDLQGGNNFVWVGAAYGLAATAIMPFTARLADTIGRRPTMMFCVGLFFLGSALAGSAQSMNWLIAARTVQGMGGGGIINLASIILSDLVSLAERGTYQGMLVMTYVVAAAIGPTIGGSLSEKATWRWLFYINLPLAGIAFILVALFLRVRTPPGTLREKLARIDWLGNLLAIAGTTLVLIALTWGGIQFPWGSAHVLAPLIIGAVLLATFLVYEKFVPIEPAIPLDILANRTSFFGYLGTFIHGIVSISIIYYLPVYFQACMDATPIRSSIMIFATTFIVSPFSVFCGVIVKVTNRYLPMNYIGWIFSIVGCGLLTLLKADSHTPQWAGFQFIAAMGIGIVWASTVFPILAPLPVTRASPALAFYNFSRVFAQTWGVTISASILQNELKQRLPADFIAQFPQGIEIAYAAIPAIRGLQDPTRALVREAFAQSLAVVWKAMIGFSAAGFVTVLLLREIPMQKHTDETHGLEGSAPLASRDQTSLEVEEEGLKGHTDSVLMSTVGSSMRDVDVD